MPRVDGVPTNRKGLRACEDVSARIASAEAYWVASGPGIFAIRPRVVVAWRQFPHDVTRFRFNAD